MRFDIEMKLTLSVHQETAVIMAASARTLGEQWVDPSDCAAATVSAMSRIENALAELVMPELAAVHIFGAEVELTTVGPPIRVPDAT